MTDYFREFHILPLWLVDTQHWPFKRNTHWSLSAFSIEPWSPTDRKQNKLDMSVDVEKFLTWPLSFWPPAEQVAQNSQNLLETLSPVFTAFSKSQWFSPCVKTDLLDLPSWQMTKTKWPGLRGRSQHLTVAVNLGQFSSLYDLIKGQ